MSEHLLGEPTISSPLNLRRFVEVGESILVHSDPNQHLESPETYELAGPREEIYFDPAETTAAIVTCGGLCPGLNDVIRAIFMQLWNGYGVRRILGIRYGYKGLTEAGDEPILLDFDEVDDIHQDGGSVLGSSRGDQDVGEMIDFMVKRGINMLFAIGGDGTQRGAMALHEEIERRGLPISIIGVPKSIDNDIYSIEKTFGFDTAVAASRPAIETAHNEAKGADNGIGIVKLMGRHSGFIAAWATLAYSEVNLTLIPEVPFKLEGEGNLLDYLEQRMRTRRHAVIVVAEGAGQDLIATENIGRDKSGNVMLSDIGPFLSDKIKEHFANLGTDVAIKYIDPSYMIRGVPAIASDSVFCLRLGQCAAHAAMAGYTGILVGSWHNHFTHFPLEVATAKRKVVDPHGWVWQSVLQSTRQPDW